MVPNAEPFLCRLVSLCRALLPSALPVNSLTEGFASSVARLNRVPFLPALLCLGPLNAASTFCKELAVRTRRYSADAFYILQNVKCILSDVNGFFIFPKNFSNWLKLRTCGPFFTGRGFSDFGQPRM